MKKHLLVTSLFFLAGCQGYDPIVYPPIPVTGSTNSANYAAADKASFENANFLYPTAGTEHHVIPIGNYFLANLTQALPDNQGIKTIRLESFDSVGRENRMFFPDVLCSSNVTLFIVDKRGKHTLAIKDKTDVGAHILVGSTSVFSSDSTYQSFVFKQARTAISHLTDKIVDAYENDGQLP